MRTLGYIEHLAIVAIWTVLPRVAKGAIYRAHRAHIKYRTTA